MHDIITMHEITGGTHLGFVKLWGILQSPSKLHVLFPIT